MTSAVPSAIEASRGSGPGRPMRCATAATARGPPARCMTRTAAVFTEKASASSTVISPRARQFPLPGDQPPSVTGVSATMSSGRTPASSAAR